jgi:hypothetical protein
VILYISELETHHKKRTFREEYLEILNKFEVEFKNEYLFEFTTDYKNQTNKEYIAALQLAEVFLFQNLLTCRCSAANNALGK